jgi:hypothetical protein
MDHGRVAAGGFLYQFLRTAEAVLLALTDERVFACRVEGDPYPDELGSTDAVDFDLIDGQEKILRSVQVKSGGPDARLSAGQVFTILARMVSKAEAEEYVLLTNTGISPGAAELGRLFETGLTRDRLTEPRNLLRGAAWERVAALSDQEFLRLRRCRISVDRRSRAELREAMLEAIRSARRKDGRGIGMQSSGLLLAYLHWETHRRADSPQDAVWLMSDVREALYLNNQALAESLGARDWGEVLGLPARVPDVPRTTLLEAIADALQPFRPVGRTVAGCTLTGLSGIGKSSLASWYVAEYLDAYDIVLWIDASSPPYTLLEGFRAAAARLGIDPDISAGQLRTFVHERLSRLAGRWLIVFDDCEAAAVLPWVPRIGDGDVLLTSVDSTLRLGTYRRIPVHGMTAPESAGLLAARLELTDGQAQAAGDLISRLAAALDYWPLALELAAGYLLSCGYTVSDIPHYLQALKIRSLDDQSSVPAGYPVTLIAAINMALTRLAVPGTDQQLLDLTASMIMEASYLSSRQIPIHLLASAAMTDLDTLPGDRGPVVFQDPHLHEIVRSLRRVSFARMDQPLPRRDGDLATAEHTIAMNSVLQEVMRDRTENHPEFPGWQANLERLAFHLDHWLASAAHNGEADKAHLLVPHVDTLVRHLQRLGLASNRIAVLTGNLAAMYAAINDFDTSIELLKTELQILLHAAEVNEFLVAQARLHLAHALAGGEQIGTSRAAEAVETLENIAVFTQRLALEPSAHDAATRFCSQSLDILRKVRDSGQIPGISQPLADTFTDVLTRLPPSWDTRARAAAALANDFLSAGQADRAEAACRPYTTPLVYGDNLQLELQRLLIEALAFQRKWEETKTELTALGARLGHNPLHRGTAQDTLHNTGLVVSAAALFGDRQAADVFAYMMSMPPIATVRSSPQPSYKAKFSILGLTLAVVEHSQSGISSHLSEVQQASMSDPALANEQGWLFLAAAAISLAGETPHR